MSIRANKNFWRRVQMSIRANKDVWIGVAIATIISLSVLVLIVVLAFQANQASGKCYDKAEELGLKVLDSRGYCLVGYPDGSVKALYLP